MCTKSLKIAQILVQRVRKLRYATAPMGVVSLYGAIIYAGEITDPFLSDQP
jgi:hypothetical protein